MNKYEKALAQTTENIEVWSENKRHYHQECKPVLIEAIKKAQALDTALDLLKQKRKNAKLDLEKTSKKYYNLSSDIDRQVVIDVGTEMETLRASIDTYTDCIATIEAEMGRGNK